MSAGHQYCTEVGGTDHVSVPLAKLTKGRVKFFSYHDRVGARIRFILARDDNGDVHAVLDACAQCGRYHQGYRPGDDEVICRYCGNHYRLRDMEKGEASCVPIKLPMTEQQGKVLVKVSDLEKEKAEF